jgi:hypothetical protein
MDRYYGYDDCRFSGLGIISMDLYAYKDKPLRRIKNRWQGSKLHAYALFNMGRDLKMKIPADITKIDVSNLGELIWWSAHLGVAPEKLLEAVGKVGNKVEVIRSYIKLH